MKSLELDVIANVEVEFDYSPGSKDYFDNGHGNWLPGDPPEVTNVRVNLPVTVKALQKALEQAQKQGKTEGFIDVDISESLSETENDSVLQECYESAAEEEID